MDRDRDQTGDPGDYGEFRRYTRVVFPPLPDHMKPKPVEVSPYEQVSDAIPEWWG